MNHWPFVIACYVVFLIFLLIDAGLPLWRRRRLLKTIAQRTTRLRRRGGQ